MAVVRAGGVDRVGSRCLGQVGDLLTQKLAVTGEGLYVTSRPCREGAWSSSSIARVSSRRSGVIMNKAIGHDFPLVDPALGHRNEAGREGSLDRGVEEFDGEDEKQARDERDPGPQVPRDNKRQR